MVSPYMVWGIQPDSPGGAVAVSVEAKQVRRSHRVDDARGISEDGHLLLGKNVPGFDGGLGIKTVRRRF